MFCNALFCVVALPSFDVFLKIKCGRRCVCVRKEPDDNPRQQNEIKICWLQETVEFMRSLAKYWIITWRALSLLNLINFFVMRDPWFQSWKQHKYRFLQLLNLNSMLAVRLCVRLSCTISHEEKMNERSFYSKVHKKNVNKLVARFSRVNEGKFLFPLDL